MPELADFQRAFAQALTAADWQGAPGFLVYRNTTARGMIEALRAAYPTVDMLVGEEMFGALADDFRRQVPPDTPVMSDYGAALPDWLEEQAFAADLPYLADVARLDRLWMEVFFAPEGKAMRLGWFATPAVTIWLAHRRPGPIADLEPEWREEGAWVWRMGMKVHVQPIDRSVHRHLRDQLAPKGIHHGHHR